MEHINLIECDFSSLLFNWLIFSMHIYIFPAVSLLSHLPYMVTLELLIVLNSLFTSVHSFT